jgi:hypothetical protein
MAVATKTVLKEYLEDGDKPSGLQFSALVDSLRHVNDHIRQLQFTAPGTFTVPLGKNLEKVFILSNSAGQTVKIGMNGVGSDDILPERVLTLNAEIVLAVDVWARAGAKTVYVEATNVTVWLHEKQVAPLT